MQSNSKEELTKDINDSIVKIEFKPRPYGIDTPQFPSVRTDSIVNKKVFYDKNTICSESAIKGYEDKPLNCLLCWMILLWVLFIIGLGSQIFLTLWVLRTTVHPVHIGIYISSSVTFFIASSAIT